MCKARGKKTEKQCVFTLFLCSEALYLHSENTIAKKLSLWQQVQEK